MWFTCLWCSGSVLSNPLRMGQRRGLVTWTPHCYFVVIFFLQQNSYVNLYLISFKQDFFPKHYLTVLLMTGTHVPKLRFV